MKEVVKKGAVISLFLLVAVVGVSPVLVAKDIGYVELDREQAGELAVLAMMASNAYRASEGRTRFPLERLGWKRVDMKGQSVTHDDSSYEPRTWFGRAFSNLQFDIWEHDRDQRTVFAFKGTDEKIDWINANLGVGVSIPYKSAKKQVEKYARRNPSRKILLTGHSLGGGLALSVSVWQGRDAYVFNSSPRVFDGRKDMNMTATRIAVYQGGDVLQKVRERHPKFAEKVSDDDVIRTDFAYGEEDPHRADLLAEGLLRCADTPALLDLADELPKRVACYLP